MAFHRRVSTGTDDVLVAAGRRVLRKVHVSNIGGTAAYLKLFNKATAPVSGTDIPVLTLWTGLSTGGGPYTFDLEPGIVFPDGIGLGMIQEAADSGVTAVTANACVAHLQYD